MKGLERADTPDIHGTTHEKVEKITESFTYVQELLNQLVRTKNASVVLKSILIDIQNKVGGNPVLAFQHKTGVWERYSLSEQAQSGGGKAVSDIISKIYDATIENDIISCMNGSVKPDILPVATKNLISECSWKDFILVSIGHSPSMILEISDIPEINNPTKYIDSIREFTIPLELTLQFTILLQESSRSEQKAHFLLDLLFHDIRSLLSSIGIALQLISMDKGSTETVDDALKQSQTAINLLSRVKNVLLSSGPRSLEPTDLKTAIEESVETIMLQFQDTKPDIVIDSRSEPSTVLVVANDLLAEVFVNLLSNSVKYTEDHTKPIIIEWSRWESNSNFICIRIKDQGRGIPEAKKQTIFSRFEMRSRGGLGLGLNIVMRLIEQYEGYLWFEDRVAGSHEHGTVVNVVLRILE